MNGNDAPKWKESAVKSRKDLKREYRERRKSAGVFQVKNTESGKVLLGSSLDIDGALNRHRFSLTTGGHPNKALQEDWDAGGADRFVFEILELVEAGGDPGFDLDGELKLLERTWIEKLEPFGERGYNTGSSIRQV